MAGTMKRKWVVPTKAQRLAAVRHARRLTREGFSSSRAKIIAAKHAGYSPASIWAWEKQFPLKGNGTQTTKRRVVKPTNGMLVLPITKSHANITVASVNLTTKDGHTMTLTKDQITDLGKIFK